MSQGIDELVEGLRSDADYLHGCLLKTRADRVRQAASRLLAMKEALERLGSSETMTTAFLRRNNAEGLELRARMDFARTALADKEAHNDG